MLSVNISKFNAISLEDTLNYTLYSQKLEKTVATISRYAVKCMNEKIKKENMSEDKAVEFYITKCLLSISAKPVWIQNVNKYKLDEDYLYIMLKKYFYQYTNNFPSN
ncbi:MAG: hypothetical protein WBL14_00855 [Caldicoprobacterales bacterium]